MTALAILASSAALIALTLAVAHLNRTGRRLQRDKRAEAIGERRAAANLYPHDHRLDVAPQQAPNPPAGGHE